MLAGWAWLGFSGGGGGNEDSALHEKTLLPNACSTFLGEEDSVGSQAGRQENAVKFP